MQGVFKLILSSQACLNATVELTGRAKELKKAIALLAVPSSDWLRQKHFPVFSE